MKRFFLLLSLAAMFCALTAFAQSEVEAPKSCKQCGMDRTMFAHSRMLVVYADGSQAGTCSLHCATRELREHPDKKVAALKVADYDSRALIDAPGATWVIGGEKSGVMTDEAKWAFAGKEAAQSFVKASGGRVAGFQQAWDLAVKEQD
ncbi:NosL family protein [Geomonas limicola]|uniref:NosL family protein n=1 Tax=Geomonas limicola TaxID=2740186 RepID=A0A6V8NBG8_9BACT|nr:nitrous oxide reductase accessory protein NosL [Geomonas limicola]GFO69790.1 NosL family protein [Geomonas limicola]